MTEFSKYGLTLDEIKELFGMDTEAYLAVLKTLTPSQLRSIAAYSYGLYQISRDSMYYEPPKVKDAWARILGRLNDKAVSPVIGVLIMVVLLVVMAAIVWYTTQAYLPQDSLKQTVDQILKP